jgi:hypothetical protein
MSRPPEEAQREVRDFFCLRSCLSATVLAATAALVTLTPLHAQPADSSPLLPDIRHFRELIADPSEPDMGIGLLVTDVLASFGAERPPFTLPDHDDARTDWQAAASIGGTITLLRIARFADGGITVGGQAGVRARFRIELPSRDDLGQDWVVAMPIEIRSNRTSARVRIIHRSSHLGDEFVQATGAQRVEYGGEALDALIAYDLPFARVYGGGAWNFRSYTRRLPALVSNDIDDRFDLQLGLDGEWRPFTDSRLHIIAGGDWRTAERIRWKGALALTGGLLMRSPDRAFGIALHFFEGRSSLGQFFNTPETYWSLELIAAL